MPKDQSHKKRLVIKEIPIPLDARHEKVPYPEVLPQHEMSWGLIAPKGAGKTTLLCNLLYAYKHYFHTIIIFSPTVKNDEKWDWVRKQDLLVENVKLKRFVKKLKEQEKYENKVVGDPPTSSALQTLVDQQGSKRDENDKFDGKIPDDCFIHEFDETTLKDILDEQQHMVDLLKENGKTKHLANRILILFDDQVGSTLFSNARRNTFKMLNTNHRHLTVSLMIVAQAFKEIPRTIRVNFTCLVLFEIYNDAELAVIYEDFPMGMKKDEWNEAYQYCVDGDHDFMFYDIQKPKALRVMKNFDQVIFFKEDKE